MSLYNFFTKLGTINYNNELVDNIIVSVRFKDLIKQTVNVFYPYTIKEGERADTIAFNYYEDERYAWVVYLSNSITDPYYQWPLSALDFNNFIIKKYGNIETAMDRIAFYRNSWYNDDSIISPAAYNALSAGMKKYWNPVIGYNNSIGSYTRKPIDLISETNQIIEVIVNSSTSFVIEEKVTQKTSGAITGTGFIKAIRDNTLVLNNIQGTFSVTYDNVGAIVGASSQTSRTVTKSTIIKTAIPANELAYYEPVSFYSYENELNESRKNIKLIDKAYLPVIEDQMNELLT